MKTIVAIVLCILSAAPAVAQESRFVTFKTVRDNWGRTEHQIDRSTIKQEGAYKTFWSRVWKDRQPVAVSADGQLFIWSQKFAVDCTQRRFAGQFINSTYSSESKRKASLQTVRWTGLEKNPAVNRAVCGGK